MDAPRRWQVASVATAIASMSLGGLLLARPTSQAVAPIELDVIVDGRELSVASPTDDVGSIATDDDHLIVTPDVPSSLAEVDTRPATPDPTEPTEVPDDFDSPDGTRPTVDVDSDDDVDSPDDDSPDDVGSIDSP